MLYTHRMDTVHCMFRADLAKQKEMERGERGGGGNKEIRQRKKSDRNNPK